MAPDPALIAQLNAAIDMIEVHASAKVSNVGDDLVAVFVYSGGHDAELQKNIPSLHLTPAGAIEDWQAQAIAWLTLERAATFRFAEVPRVEKLVMTEKEDGGMRLAATRYGVMSKIAVLTRKSNAKAKVKPRKKVPKVKTAPSRTHQRKRRKNEKAARD